MLRTDRQLRIAQERLAEIETARDASSEQDRPTWDRLAIAVKCEITEYQQLKSGALSRFEVNELNRLGEALIKARLAKGWTQKALADELGVAEQQVQRDERHDYESAGLARVADIIDALGYELHGVLKPATQSQRVFDATSAAFAPAIGGSFQQFGPAEVRQLHRCTSRPFSVFVGASNEA